MLFELVETGLPQSPVLMQPLIHLAQRLAAKSVEASLRFGSNVHQAGLAKNAQVLGNGRLADLQMADKVTDRPLAFAEEFQDPPPIRFCNDLERLDHGS